MKKYLITLTCAFLCFSLCGCSMLRENARDDRNFMVSAIGFETDGALITVCVETVIINSELPEAEPERVPELPSLKPWTVSALRLRNR